MLVVAIQSVIIFIILKKNKYIVDECMNPDVMFFDSVAGAFDNTYSQVTRQHDYSKTSAGEFHETFKVF